MRNPGLAFLWTIAALLGACSESVTPGPMSLSGTWQDSSADFTTCGETSPVTIGLELVQTGNMLKGTFELNDVISSFKGEHSGSAISGEVANEDGTAALLAELDLRKNKLTGSFVATQSIGCAAGGTSVTRYDVNLEKN